MIETTFYLNTTREIFESWLVKKWKPAMFDTAAGGQYSLDRARQRGGKVTIDGAFATAPNAEDVSTCYLLGAVITFEVTPLEPGRIEVSGTCYSSGDQTEAAYLELLAMIGARWPESGLAALLAPEDDAAPAPIPTEEPTAPAGPEAERLEYLRKHYLKMTDGEMAEELSITADWVKKLRLQHGMRKRPKRKGIPKQSP